MVSATVTFTEVVTVDDMSGTNKPELELNFNGSAKPASYASGSGTTALVFSYEVADGDADADGIAIGENKLTLNGGTITGGGVHAEVLTHGVVVANAGHKVDGVKPTVAVTASTTPVTEQAPFTVTFTFSEPVSGFALEDVTVTNGALADLEEQAPNDSTTWTATGTVTAGASGMVTVAVAAAAVTDAVSNPGKAGEGQFEINALPVFTSGTAKGVVEGLLPVSTVEAEDADSGDEVTRTHFATIEAQGWRVVEAPEPHAVSRGAFAELAEYAFVGVHGADPHLVDGPVVPFAIRTTHRAVCVNIVVSSGLVMCGILCPGVAAPSAARDP